MTDLSTTTKSRGPLDILIRAPEASVVLIGILLLIAFQIASPNFLSNANLQTVSQFVAPWAIIACGEIDLSAGMMFALTPFLMHFAALAGMPLLLAIVVSLLLSAALGLCIGIVTVHFNVPSFITTLGALLLFNGITLTISRGYPIDAPGGTLSMFFGGWQYSYIIWAVAIVAVMHVVLRHTRWGLHTVAVGGNLVGAAEAGIHVRRIKLGNFMLSSTLSGFAGILNAFHVTSIDPAAGGSNVMFLAVASSVIGGTSLLGGSGTVLGGLVGAMVLGILQDGFTLIGINAFTFDIITGAAILITMAVNVQMAAMRRRRI